MPELTVDKFLQMDAFHSLIEENTLAIIESTTFLKVTAELRTVTKALARQEDPRILVEGMRRTSDVVQRRRAYEMDYLREVINRRLLFSRYQTLLEEVGLWKKPTLRSR